MQVLQDKRFIDEANLFGEALIGWVLLQPGIQDEFKNLVIKTIDDQDVKEATINVMQYIVS